MEKRLNSYPNVNDVPYRKQAQENYLRQGSGNRILFCNKLSEPVGSDMIFLSELFCGGRTYEEKG